MFDFMNSDLSAFKAFWQFVKRTNMDYNLFKSKMRLNAYDEVKLRKLWDDIHYGRAKFENLKKDFIEKSLDKNSKSLADYVNEIIDLIYQSQTGIGALPLMSDIMNYNDVMNWDSRNIESVFERMHDALEEVPFITKTVKFNAKKNKKPDTHVSITTIERKVPNGPFTIKEYDSDNNVINEYNSNAVYCPLIYEWDKEDGTKQQKPGNLMTK